MSDMSVYLANELLDHVLKNSTYTPPTSLWIALFTSSAGLDSNNSLLWTEVSGGSYARVEVGGASGIDFNTATSGSTTNDAVITFATATVNWGTVTHIAIMDASTAGNVLFWTGIGAGISVTTGDAVKVNTAGLSVSIT